ncbi:hypothetical protein C8R43DRAFT_949313 [Mycena crocata]|nr:hypothetical protein C8R43DRAFT_949313 [Mycena crocata]
MATHSTSATKWHRVKSTATQLPPKHALSQQHVLGRLGLDPWIMSKVVRSALSFCFIPHRSQIYLGVFTNFSSNPDATAISEATHTRIEPGIDLEMNWAPTRRWEGSFHLALARSGVARIHPADLPLLFRARLAPISGTTLAPFLSPSGQILSSTLYASLLGSITGHQISSPANEEWLDSRWSWWPTWAAFRPEEVADKQEWCIRVWIKMLALFGG